ncbi:heme exporter protein A [Martelella radicis]|uniref:Heme exporter protein A n=1 Tax=Martelella radicis TaxID=1397476 RepID=A0A7W6PC71_9HYPH|nr:heme exporter protein A [Martelella radicis]
MALRIEAAGLSVSRGDMLIFSNLSLTLVAGQSMVFTGPNGAGKSTALRALLGLVGKTGGHAHFIGDDENALPLAFAAHYLAHQNAMKQELTARENLALWKRILGDFQESAGLDPEEAVEAVGLEGVLDLPFAYLSAGQKRRIAFARLLVAHRPVWLLDEPTAALDKAARETVAALMNSHLGDGGIIIAATHEPLGLEAAEAMAFTGPTRLVADPFMAEAF